MDLQAEKKPWYKQKTTQTAILTIIGQVVGMVTGTISMEIALPVIGLSVQTIFQRQGVENSK